MPKPAPKPAAKAAPKRAAKATSKAASKAKAPSKAKATSRPKAPSNPGALSRRTIATRQLLYSVRGSSERKPFTLCITEPYLLTGDVGFKYGEGAAGCTIVFDGLPEFEITVHGVDRIQALELAVDVDPVLRGLNRRKYDFFWEDGEPYFEPI